MKKFLLIFTGIVLGFLVFFLIKINQFYKDIYIPKKNDSQVQTEKTIYNVVFLGYAGEGHDGPYLTDTIIVIHIDLKKNQIVQISIPRDVWLKIPTKSGASFHAKVNTLYEMYLFPKDFPDVKQSPNVVFSGIEQITGLPIDNYVAVDFSGFIKMIDILGGVDVNVQTAFDDPQYPVEGHEKDLCGKQESDLPELEKIATQSPELAFPCRYENLHFGAGLQHMDGATALKFVRSRHSPQDGGDFARARRQQLFLEAVKNKVLSIGFVTKIIPLLDELSKHVKTDIPFELSKKFAAEITEANKYQISHMVLSDRDYLDDSFSSNGQFILIPKEGIDNWSHIHQVIKNAIAGTIVTPTPIK
jgi:LCP family protein required for cell wall assembly